MGFVRRQLVVVVGSVVGWGVFVWGLLSDAYSIWDAGWPPQVWIAVGVTLFIACLALLIYRAFDEVEKVRGSAAQMFDAINSTCNGIRVELRALGDRVGLLSQSVESVANRANVIYGCLQSRERAESIASAIKQVEELLAMDDLNGMEMYFDHVHRRPAWMFDDRLQDVISTALKCAGKIPEHRPTNDPVELKARDRIKLTALHRSMRNVERKLLQSTTLER